MSTTRASPPSAGARCGRRCGSWIDAASKELHLPRVALGVDQGGARFLGHAEAQRIHAIADPVEAEPLHRRAEASAQKLGDRALAFHAQAEARLVEGAAADLADQRQHALSTVGPVLAQPFLEQLLDLE